MSTELLGIPGGKALAVDLTEVVRAQLALRAVRHESFVEVQDCCFVIVSIPHEKLQVILRQPF